MLKVLYFFGCIVVLSHSHITIAIRRAQEAAAELWQREALKSSTSSNALTVETYLLQEQTVPEY